MSEDLLLVHRILADDYRAWHEFIELYSPFMKRIIHRYVTDAEIRRDLFVYLLEKLKYKKLLRFDGKSSLKTWLFIVTKNHCRDYYRSAQGVRHILTALECLDRLDRQYFRLSYVERMPLREVYASLRLQMGDELSFLDLLECEERIRKKMERKKLGKVLDKLLNPEVRSIIPIGGIVHSPPKQSVYPAPDLSLDMLQLDMALDNLRAAILNLPSKDQIILKLRFEHKMSARRIGDVLDLGNEKQVYRKLTKLFDELKTMLVDAGLGGEAYAELVSNIEQLCSLRDTWMNLGNRH
jgi:DNA-directed RNA polymerase specialized sigma24 family protein